MNKIHYLDRMLTHLLSFNVFKVNSISSRCFCRKSDSGGGDTNTTPIESPIVEKEARIEMKNNVEIPRTEVKLSGFARSYEKFSSINKKIPEIPQTFASLIRHSKFVDLGDPEGKLVIGEVYHVIDDDLYIDFGWKFHCVCRRPAKNKQYYVRGSTVRLRIKDLELSSKFLGATTDITLLEADCTLMGLISSPLKMEKQRTKKQNIVSTS